MFLCLDIAKELSKKGYEITIYTTDMDFANNPKTFNKNLPRVEQIENFRIKRSHVWFSVGLFFINPGMYFQLMKDSPDIIHSVGVRSFQSYIAYKVAKKKNIPLIVSDQGGLTTHPDLKQSGIIKKLLYKIQFPMVRFIINQATKISVANEYEKNIFSQFCPDSKIVIIRNGVNLEELKSVSIDFKKKYSIDDRYILFVGRFNKVKGIDTLIQAISLINSNPVMANVVLVILGVDFGFESDMKKMIKHFGLEKKIMVIKKPPREDVIAAYSMCEFLVLPSRWELSPLTPLEGFVFKKPTISTKSHGIPYTITDGKDSVLVNPENPTQLANAIIELLKNSEKKEELGNNGFNLVKETCNSKTMAKETLKLYQEAL